MISTGRRLLLATGGLALAGLLSACGGDGDVTVTPQGSAGTCVQAGDASVCAGPSGAVAAGGGAVASVGPGGASVDADTGSQSADADTSSGSLGGGAGVRHGGAEAKVATSGALTLDATAQATCTTASSVKQIVMSLPESTELQLSLTGDMVGEVTLTQGQSTFVATWVLDPGSTVDVQDSSVTVRGLRLAGDDGEVVLNAQIGC